MGLNRVRVDSVAKLQKKKTSIFWNRVSSSRNVRQTKYIFITKKVLAIYANLCYSTKMSVSMGKCAFLRGYRQQAICPLGKTRSKISRRNYLK